MIANINRMGSRTQNHIIEDKSRLFFKGLLPQFWICRDKHEDYGIDCEVEIFDTEGNPTGYVFWVQLKGTASKEVNTIQSMTFKNEKIDQFKSYEIPVMIVRYSSVKKACYFKWAASIYRPNRDAASTKVVFPDNSIWGVDSDKEIISYLKRQSHVRAHIVFPVKTVVRRTPTTLKSKIPFGSQIALKGLLSDFPSYFSLTNQESESLLQISIEEKQLVFSFTDVAFASLGLDIGSLGKYSEENISQHILLTFCSALFELKRNELASAIFFDHNLFDLAKKDSIRLSYFMLPLLSGVTFSRTMKLLNAHLLAEPQDNNFLEAIINMVILPRRDYYDDGQLLLVEDFLLLSIKLAEETGSGFVIGTACYNLANFYRGIGNNKNALKYYMETRRHKPGYKLYDYYYGEIAGVLFLLGKFYLAEILYRKAIELNSGAGMMKALLADCLIYQGKYEQAISTLDVFLTEQHDKIEYLDEWYLKFSCLGTLLSNGYPNSQQRSVEEGEALVIAGKNYEALQADMLNGQAWYLIGLDDAKNGDRFSAFFDFAMAGLINVRSVDSWINATILCLDENIGNNLLDYVVKTAYFYNGQSFLTEFFSVINNHPNADKIMEGLEKILPATPERPMFIRFFSGDDEFETLSLTK